MDFLAHSHANTSLFVELRKRDRKFVDLGLDRCVISVGSRHRWESSAWCNNKPSLAFGDEAQSTHRWISSDSQYLRIPAAAWLKPCRGEFTATDPVTVSFIIKRVFREGGAVRGYST